MQRNSLKYPLPFNLSPLPLSHYLGGALGEIVPLLQGQCSVIAEHN